MQQRQIIVTEISAWKMSTVSDTFVLIKYSLVVSVCCGCWFVLQTAHSVFAQSLSCSSGDVVFVHLQSTLSGRFTCVCQQHKGCEYKKCIWGVSFSFWLLLVLKNSAMQKQANHLLPRNGGCVPTCPTGIFAYVTGQASCHSSCVNSN